MMVSGKVLEKYFGVFSALGVGDVKVVSDGDYLSMIAIDGAMTTAVRFGVYDEAMNGEQFVAYLPTRKLSKIIKAFRDRDIQFNYTDDFVEIIVGGHKIAMYEYDGSTVGDFEEIFSLDESSFSEITLRYGDIKDVIKIIDAIGAEEIGLKIDEGRLIVDVETDTTEYKAEVEGFVIGEERSSRYSASLFSVLKKLKLKDDEMIKLKFGNDTPLVVSYESEDGDEVFDMIIAPRVM